MEASHRLEVLDPTPERHGGKPEDTAPRLDTLEGKTVGLLWNGKALGDVALKRTAELISERVPNVTFKFYSGSMPNSPKLLEDLVKNCDAAIGCTADCGSCTSWITHDCVQLERKGKPTVIIASSGFEHDVEASARAFAMPDPFYVVVPKVYNNLDEAQAIGQTDPVVDEVISKLVSGATVNRVSSDGKRNGSWTYTSTDDVNALIDFNQDFLDRDWGDGYPLWPPTRKAVEELIGGVDGDKDDVVCLLPPGNGEATVEKVAVNAAMAGCRPEEMPVIMAALRAIANIRPVPRGALMSTSAHAPLVLVNGPLGHFARHQREAGVPWSRQAERGQHQDQPCDRLLPQEHRVLDPRCDGPRHHRNDPQAHRRRFGKRGRKSLGALPRVEGLRSLR